jgi:hypothetical protein
LETTGTQFNDALDVDVDRDLDLFKAGEDAANQEDYMLAVLKDLPTLDVIQTVK